MCSIDVGGAIAKGSTNADAIITGWAEGIATPIRFDAKVTNQQTNLHLHVGSKPLETPIA